MQTLTLMGLGFAIGFAIFALSAAVRIARDPFARYGVVCVAKDRFRSR